MSETREELLKRLEYEWTQLRNAEEQIKPLEEYKNEIRERIGILVSQLGTVVLPGYGKAMITALSRTYNYDKGKIDELVGEIIQTYPHLAQKLVAARKFTERDGSLRIEHEKPKV